MMSGFEVLFDLEVEQKLTFIVTIQEFIVSPVFLVSNETTTIVRGG